MIDGPAEVDVPREANLARNGLPDLEKVEVLEMLVVRAEGSKLGGAFIVILCKCSGRCQPLVKFDVEE